MPPPTPTPSKLGHYQILKKLGEGGMGSVFLAEDTQLKCRIALKILRYRASSEANAVERFYREARMAQSIHHPYVCPVYDVGELDGMHFLSMAFIEGSPLNRMIGRQEDWPQRRTAELMRKVALALEALHQRQVIHRDLKPHNIMVRTSDEPVLMDFGLARSLDDSERLTSTGQTLGTPAYMPPELIRSKDALGPATDVYSLGVILYELLTGRPPFTAKSLWELFNHVLNTPPPPPSTFRPDLSPELEAICLQTLAKDASERFVSMADLASALDEYLKDQSEATVALPQPPRLDQTLAYPAASGPASSSSGASGEVEAPCPHCGRRLKLSPALWNKKARCTACKQEFRVPEDLVLPDTFADMRAAGRETAPRGRSGPSQTRELVSATTGMRLVWIPPGAFLMGSPPDEDERFPDETRHRVTLTRGFYLGVFPVTQAQWVAVMGGNPSYFPGDERPVENVCWLDGQEFCRRLSRLDCRPCRLPTEAEWEYACRAGTTTPFSFGETISSDQANFDGHFSFAGGPKGIHRRETTPVGAFPPNAWGLYDMHGNVWEWCADRHGPYPTEDVTDPQGSKSSEGRVLRGGSWVYGPRACRSACRLRNEATFVSNDFGFRVCFCPAEA